MRTVAELQQAQDLEDVATNVEKGQRHENVFSLCTCSCSGELGSLRGAYTELGFCQASAANGMRHKAVITIVDYGYRGHKDRIGVKNRKRC